MWGRPCIKLILLKGIPEEVSHAGNNLSAISFALSRNILSPDRSYVLSKPPTTLNNQKEERERERDLSKESDIMLMTATNGETANRKIKTK